MTSTVLSASISSMTAAALSASIAFMTAAALSASISPMTSAALFAFIALIISVVFAPMESEGKGSNAYRNQENLDMSLGSGVGSFFG